VLPNFGDELGVVHTLDMAKLNVPVLVQACDDEEPTKLKAKERRDALISGLERIGWSINCPKGTMFVWGKIPEQYVKMGSVEFSKFMIKETKVAVSTSAIRTACFRAAIYRA
jgi:aspartate/methionine/tyrosine aminotransferase